MRLRDHDFIRPGVLCLGLVLSAVAPAPLQAYSGVADITLSWGVNGTAISWTSSAPGNNLALPDNLTQFTARSGSNGTIHFNPDFAAATGTLNFTETTLTGTLTVLATTDESSTGKGASGFNVRALDTSTYGNVWYGVSTGATLTVDLTGDFSAASWEITGGTVRLSDPGFQCQQGHVGGIAPDYVLCQVGAVPGGFSKNGSHLSFGLDADGGLAGIAMTPVQVRDTAGMLVASLSGVIASINVGPGGSLSTAFGEYRAGTGIGTSGCGYRARSLCVQPGNQRGVQYRGDVKFGHDQRHRSAATPGTDTVRTLNIGGITGAFTSTTIPVNTIPDAFSFTDLVDVAADTEIVSGPVVISGINSAAPVSVTGGDYSVGCNGLYATTPGSVSPGQSVCVRHISAALPLTATDTTLTVGGVADTFTSTTAAAPPDTTPDAFTFGDRADVAVSTVITSAPPVTISGINASTPVSITGGSYTVSVDCTGPFTTAPGSVTNGQEICVRHTSAGANSTPTSTRLTVGGVSDTFTSTTVAAIPPDTTPKPFSFVDQSDVPVSTVIHSAPVSISEIDAPAPVSVIGGQYSVGCTATFITAEGTISNGQAICVRHTSAAANSTSTGTTLTVGGVSDTFTSTTVAAAGGGGGGAVDLSLIVLLAALPALRRRINKRRVVR